MPVPAEAYELFAAGEISAGELADLEKFAESLEKNAGFLDTLQKLTTKEPTMIERLPAAAAAVGGLTLAAPALAYAGSQVPKTIQSTLNSMRFNSGLRKTLEMNPHLGSEDDPNIRMAYKTIQTTNPEYAKDPLIAGTILDMVMNNRMDPNDPSSPPRFEPGLLNDIQKSRDKTPDASSAIGSGARAALEL